METFLSTPHLAAGWHLIRDGGPAMWVIAALSVVALALILWKSFDLLALGAWRKARSEAAILAWQNGDAETALKLSGSARGVQGRMVHTAIRTLMRMPEAQAREQTRRVAQDELAKARYGLRALETIATIAPLLGLFGTVLGMISAFQALETAGGRADPSTLAGGIWEALLTTAAGMAVAIPAGIALNAFEGALDGLRHRMQDAATRIFAPEPLENAPEIPMAAA